MRTLLLASLLTLGAAAPLQADTIYRTVDENGTVTYSDRPPPGAEDAEPSTLPPLNRVPEQTPAQRDPGTPRDNERDTQPAIDYRLTLLSPAPESSVPPGQRDLPIVVETSPVLAPGHTFVYYLDGEIVSQSRASQHTIEEIFRGAHQIRVAITDANGDVLSETQPVTIYVHRPSKLN